ncbi:pyridoxal phosphate-dependent aminotransferase [Candidiatus Paracoxiella cheracis]|uniref:pyridoxal phosphate-dependent aminotransferase n=1 Tax=Candidiatus Paracoxiella cheracis TaxID=3405120 RepID=UPI003BF5732D
MTTELSERTKKIEPSATLAVGALARELKSQGRDIINLSQGEPDFATPDAIKEAAIQAIHDNFTKYTNVDGYVPLKEAIVNKFKRDNQLDYDLKEIVVSSGAKQSIYNCALSVLNPGDEAIIPAPYWVSYPEIVKMAEGIPVEISAGIDQHFKITAQQLEAAITPKTRLFIINSPRNPTGMAYTAAELKALANVLLKHPKIIIMSDDIYEYILWNGTFANLLNVCPELRNRTIIVNGASKAYAMTGWRIGYAAGPAEIIQAMKKIQSQSTGCPNSIAQVATKTALEFDRSKYLYMVEAYQKRNALVIEKLKSMNGVSCIPSDGAFYSFIDVTKTMQRLKLSSDIELAKHILNEANVAVVPGTPFGASGYIRISYATSEEKLNKALERLAPIMVK